MIFTHQILTMKFEINRKHKNKFYNESFKKIKENKKEINIYSSLTANQQVDIVDNIIKKSKKKYTIILHL